MALIHVFVAVFVVATALGLEPCNPGRFQGTGFDAFHFRPVSVLHDNITQATLYRSAIEEDDFDLLDYENGIFYTIHDGECQYFQHDEIRNLLRVAASASNVPSVLEIDDYAASPVYGFEFWVPNTEVIFKGLQHTEDGVCNHIYVGISVENLLRAAFFHQNIDAADESALEDLHDALKQVRAADCSEMIL